MSCHAGEIPLEPPGHLCDAKQHKIPCDIVSYMNSSNKQLLDETVKIWGKKHVADEQGKHHSEITKWLPLENSSRLDDVQTHALEGLLPPRPVRKEKPAFQFIDLFAGIGGIRKGSEAIGGECVFTSE